MKKKTKRIIIANYDGSKIKSAIKNEKKKNTIILIPKTIIQKSM